jgi:uncharacterized repeat protein (TIGR04076 family)
MKLIIVAKEIYGKCPVYKRGHEVIIKNGYILKVDKQTSICMHSLSSLMPFYIALSRKISSKELGLTKEGENAFFQCPDPYKFKGGDTAVFEIKNK